MHVFVCRLDYIYVVASDQTPRISISQAYIKPHKGFPGIGRIDIDIDTRYIYSWIVSTLYTKYRDRATSRCIYI